jgi:hypothetical protein
MRDVATQSRMLQRLTSNSLRMQLPDLTVDVILARTSSLSCRLNVYTILAQQTLRRGHRTTCQAIFELIE